MKPLLFALLTLFLSQLASAQNKITTPISLAKQTWQVDSISGLDNFGSTAKKLKKELGLTRIAFLENGHAWLFLDKECALMDYDLSKGSKGTYLNFSGFLMFYVELLEVEENSLVLGFQFPKSLNSEFGKFHLSKVPYSLTDSLQFGLKGNYVLEEFVYGNYGNPTSLSNTTHMRLFEDGKMICNFGTLDSGTWAIDANKLELRLQGQSALYHFSIENYVVKNIRLNTIAAANESSYNLYKSAFVSFDDENEYQTDVVLEETEMYEDSIHAVQVADDTAAMDYGTEEYAIEEYVPEKSQSDMLSISWKAFAFTDNGEIEMPKSDIYLTFDPDGTVYYTSGKKKTKGSWKLKERSQTMVLTWNKKEEVAQYWWDYFYYDESYSTKTSLNIVFTPPGEKKAVTIEFRPMTTE